MKDLIKKDHTYAHSIDRVWAAITDPAQITAWFIKANFKAEVGYDYTFQHEQTIIKGKVLEVSPVTKLVYTWNVSGTGDVETTVSWQLSPIPEGTHLTLEHSGISNYPEEGLATTMFDNFSKGWINCISELEKYLKEVAHA
ncbi:SRPBCC domain-containing protein [Fulvivirga sp. M361]|uniref:SRPBCC family protein n=1 Tax=Fulvivirga sp. M361 TaxID=2594266 RepID=UPI00117B1E9A|nr:SRPBCC domain-containing protein [Fulvivirga sp. M361]TRX62660.1 SRPBCC domain-containing protein [Fulvivirga sp. M361]